MGQSIIRITPNTDLGTDAQGKPPGFGLSALKDIQVRLGELYNGWAGFGTPAHAMMHCPVKVVCQVVML